MEGSRSDDEGRGGPLGNDGDEAEPTGVEPVADAETGEELGEVAGGGGVTDLGGDSPSS